MLRFKARGSDFDALFLLANVFMLIPFLSFISFCSSLQLVPTIHRFPPLKPLISNIYRVSVYNLSNRDVQNTRILFQCGPVYVWKSIQNACQWMMMSMIIMTAIAQSDHVWYERCFTPQTKSQAHSYTHTHTLITTHAVFFSYHSSFRVFVQSFTSYTPYAVKSWFSLTM